MPRLAAPTLIQVVVLLRLMSLATAAFHQHWMGKISNGHVVAKKNHPVPTTSDATTVITTAAEPLQLRIRSTRKRDIPAVASFLSTAVVDAKETSQSPNGGVTWSCSWKKKMDRLWAQSDIESLLLGRWHAIQEGKARYQSVADVFLDNELCNDDRGNCLFNNDSQQLYEQQLQELEHGRLQFLWNSSHRFRSLLKTAAKATGENNLWQHHDFTLTPADTSWLNHLQMTAEDRQTGNIVGFCEIAMLSNPLHHRQQQQKISDHGNNNSKNTDQYAPAIANLAVSPHYRRRGVASRLLQAARRYVQQEWGTQRLGLYVEQDNKAAVALYQKLGYEITVACDGGARLGDMWYMVHTGSSATTSTATDDVVSAAAAADDRELARVER